MQFEHRKVIRILSLTVIVGFLALVGLVIIYPENFSRQQLNTQVKNDPSAKLELINGLPELSQEASEEVDASMAEGIDVSETTSLTTTGNDPEKSKQALELLEQARKAIDRAEPQTAQVLLEKVLELDPNNDQALFELGMLYLIDYRNKEKARLYLEATVAVNSGNQHGMSELVNLYFETDSIDEGIRNFRELADKHPETSHYPLAAGQLLMDADRYAEALPFLKEAVEKGTQPEQSLADLSRTHAKLGEYALAAQACQQALAKQEELIRKALNDTQTNQQNGLDHAAQITAMQDTARYMRLDCIEHKIYAGLYEEAESELKMLKAGAKNDDAVDERIKLLNRLRRG
ncbi:MAG: tetratricopeptide repeat protein [Oligoflexales bacterium]|jgi:tetratricopeptide (TPR) repeat protein|nr:tetratricopeptide repeat protein [Oligoflexales bacterium]